MSDDLVMTVLGPVPADRLGPALAHEHVLVDLRCYWQPPQELSRRAFAEAPVETRRLGQLRRDPQTNLDNCVLDDLEVAIEELGEFRRLGGGTVVDVTLSDIGRDPVALQIAARETGLHIVAGCGHYVHVGHPPSLEAEPLEAIAERLVRELTHGIGTSGVRPGVIGEIGTSDPLHPREEKVLRAAARAQAATGAPITIHTFAPTRNGHELLDVLEEEGANLGRVVLDHLDLTLGQLDATFDEALAYHRSLAERGCFVEYDCCGKDYYFAEKPGYQPAFWCPSDRERARGIAALIEAGFGSQLLLSHDTCLKIDLVRNGGHGYGHVLRYFTQDLRDVGLGEAEIQMLLVDNPRRMLVPST